MKKFFKRTLIVFLILAGLAALWWWNYPINSMRYRLTVEVEADGKVHTGSSVNELQVLTFPRLLPGVGPSTRIRGEAVAVDLGPRGTLFMLLLGTRWQKRGAGSGDPYTVPTRELGIRIADASEIRGLPFLRTGPVEIPFDHLNRSALLRFSDTTEPPTYGPVDPTNLAANFGPGVRLLRVTIETTRDPVTRKIESYIPWVGPDLLAYTRKLPRGRDSRQNLTPRQRFIREYKQYLSRETYR